MNTTPIAVRFHGTFINLGECIDAISTHTRRRTYYSKPQVACERFSSCDSFRYFRVFERAVFCRANPSFEFIALPFHGLRLAASFFDGFLAGDFGDFNIERPLHIFSRLFVTTRRIVTLVDFAITADLNDGFQRHRRVFGIDGCRRHGTNDRHLCSVVHETLRQDFCQRTVR